MHRDEPTTLEPNNGGNIAAELDVEVNGFIQGE